MDNVDLPLIASSALGGYMVYWVYCMYDPKKDNYNMHYAAGIATSVLLYSLQVRFPYIPDLSRKVMGGGAAA